jgi:hypothetical protein
MIISCSKEEVVTDVDAITKTSITEDTSKSRAQIGISLIGTTAVCDRLGPRIKVHLQYVGTPTYDYAVFIDLYKEDGITLVDTWPVSNNNNQNFLDVIIGNPPYYKACSILEDNTDYLIRIRYNTVEAYLQPTSTSLLCICPK